MPTALDQGGKVFIDVLAPLQGHLAKVQFKAHAPRARRFRAQRGARGGEQGGKPGAASSAPRLEAARQPDRTHRPAAPAPGMPHSGAHKLAHALLINQTFVTG